MENKELLKSTIDFWRILSNSWMDMVVCPEYDGGIDETTASLCDAGYIFCEFTHFFQSSADSASCFTRTYSCYGKAAQCRHLLNLQWNAPFGTVHTNPALKRIVKGLIGDGETIKIRCKLTTAGEAVKAAIEDGQENEEDMMRYVLRMGQYADRPSARPYVSEFTIKPANAPAPPSLTASGPLEVVIANKEPVPVAVYQEPPAVELDAKEWVHVSQAATRLGVSVDTLARYRTAGTKPKGDNPGKDSKGNIWRYTSNRSHTEYLLPPIDTPDQ